MSRTMCTLLRSSLLRTTFCRLSCALVQGQKAALQVFGIRDSIPALRLPPRRS